MNFTAPYIRLPAVIIVRRELQGSLDLAAMGGMRVAVVRGYATHDYVRENHPELELVLVPSIEDGLQKVSFGSADAVVANVAAASYYIERAGLANLRVAGESGFVWNLAMGARSDWPELQGILQKALDGISDEERRAIYRRWIALESTPQGWGRRELVIGAVILGVALILFILAKLLGRKRSATAMAQEVTLSESWPVMLTAAVSIAAVIVAALWTPLGAHRPGPAGRIECPAHRSQHHQPIDVRLVSRARE